jgi:UDP-3-O-[3-hydroxymyristoyl] glucosamine N-acyltransferase
MQFTAQQIADLLQGTVEGGRQRHRLATFQDRGRRPRFALLPGQSRLYAVLVHDHRFRGHHRQGVRAARACEDHVGACGRCPGCIRQLLELYNRIKLDKKGISSQAAISENATLGNDCYVGALAFIGENVRLGNNVKIYPQAYVGDNVSVGDNTTLFAGVKIYSDCTVGRNCIIHSGTVIGSDGFRFATGPEGGAKIPQIGNVVIEDDVEIGANCAIDRANARQHHPTQRRQIRQPDPHRAQRGGGREHLLRRRWRGGGFHQDRQELHVQRAGGHHRPFEDR